MSRFGSTEGRGYIKLIIAVVVVGFGINAAYQFLKLRVAHAELKDHVIEAMKYAGQKNWDADDIKYQINLKVKDLDLPIGIDAIMVAKVDSKQWSTKISYDTPYKIPGYEKTFHWEIDETWTLY